MKLFSVNPDFRIAGLTFSGKVDSGKIYMKGSGIVLDLRPRGCRSSLTGVTALSP